MAKEILERSALLPSGEELPERLLQASYQLDGIDNDLFSHLGKVSTLNWRVTSQTVVSTYGDRGAIICQLPRRILCHVTSTVRLLSGVGWPGRSGDLT